MQETNQIISGIEGIGTKWFFEFFEEINIDEIENLIRKVIKEFEENYSRFKETSKLSNLNLNRKFQNTDEEFLDLINIGKNFYRESQGIFNFGLAKVLESRGYDKNYSFEEKDEQEIPDLTSAIEINEKEIKLNGNFDLDFGGFGKGYLIDKLSEKLKAKGIKYFLINGGGDIYVTSDIEKEVKLYLQNPIKEDEYIFEVQVKNKSLCCSSAFKRNWTTKNTNKNFSHVVKTSNEDKEIASTFCISPKAVISDIFCTIAMMKYEEKSFEELCEKYEVKYLAVSERLEIVGNNGLI